ncbi:MAG TPA: NlpC/P60 family protein [Xanthobacteraceae bacterium]|nr:NlpC/P60 family protein [Xanthobacteraceae bacterium]
MILLDPRLTPARPDLAARYLQGAVEAERFVEGTVLEVVDAQAPLRRAPAGDAPLETEALLGERVIVYEISDEGWAWGQLEADRYVGYLPANALAAPGARPTHTVAALRTLIFPGPSIKLPPVAAPSLGARLAIAHHHERFAVTAAGGFVPASHLVPLGHKAPDFVAVAERFVGVPYLWGGKTSFGLDCSGLVQVALGAAGLAAPRDTDMQERSLGVAVMANADHSNLQRADLMFWRGHVAIVRDPFTLVHANAYHMAVAREPIVEAIARIRATDGEPTGVRRI